ncbi:MAG: polysaccharide deacetylase family protein [Pseudoxanthomonas sp.]
MRRRLLAWARYAIALAAHYSGADFLFRKASGAGLVVLMLHRLRDEPDPYPLSTSRASFGKLVGWLRQRNALVDMESGLRGLDGVRRSGIAYALTFDDGYRDNLALLDAGLKDAAQNAVPAIVYVATGHVGRQPIWAYQLQHAVEAHTVGRLDLGMLGLGQFDLSEAFERERLYLQLPPRLKLLEPSRLQESIDCIVGQLQPRPGVPEGEMLDWEDVSRLQENGVQIGAHTRHHVILQRADEQTARAEIQDSLGDIAAATHRTPAHFAYPNGSAADFGENHVRMVKEAGFRTAVTTIEGTNRRGADPYRLLRHNVHEQRYRAPPGHLSPALFFSETSGLLGWLRLRRSAA